MAAFDNVRRYLRLPSRSERRIRRDIDAELALQIELRTEELQRTGLSLEAARAEARRRFGDLDAAKRYCADVDLDAERRRRATGWLSEVAQDARHTLRALRRSPSFTIATVLTLGLAIAGGTAVSSVLYTYLLRPLPFPNADRLVSLSGAPSRDRSRRDPPLHLVNWRAVDSLFSATAAWDLDGFTIIGAPHAETVTGAWVTPGYFTALSVRPALGRIFAEAEYGAPAPVAVISYDLWQRRFAGDSGALGSTITMHSNDRPDAASMVTVIGILPRDFWPIQWRESDVLRPLPRGENSVPVLGLLAPGASRLATAERVEAIVRAQLGSQVDSSWHARFESPLSRHSDDVRSLLFAVLGAAVFMLLAACGSVAGALVSRMAARRNEIAVRVALGGSRWRLVRQLLTESLVLTVLAGALGVVIAYGVLDFAGPVIERQLGTRVPGGVVRLRPTSAIVLLSAGVSIAAGLLVGLVPAAAVRRVGRAGASADLLGAGRSLSSRGGATGLRRVLIAGQVMVAMVLLFGAGLMFRTIARMQSLDVGFRVDGVVAGSVLLPSTRYADSSAKRAVMDRLLSGITKTKGVRAAALVFPQPFGNAWRAPVLVEGAGQTDETAPQSMVFTVSPSYFATMGLRLRAGRAFGVQDDASAPLAVVISEGLARRIAPSGGVLGRRIRVRVPYAASFDDVDERPWRTVVGIVNDTQKEFAAASLPDIYVPYAQNPRSWQTIVVRTDRAEAAVLDPVRRAVSGVDPELAFSGARPMSEVIAAQGGQRRGLSVLLGVFAAFTLGLSALALYASLSYTVLQRRAELAVRMALGADARSILRVVVTEGVATAAIGLTAGAAASLALGRVLRNQVYGVATTDPVTLVSISLVLVAAVAAACVAPALRAVRTDPALVLRE